MNNLMTRKKKYRFQVELRVEELQHVPFLCQELYVKVRLLNGGFTSHSQSLKVENQRVVWDETFRFRPKMTANASTGELDSCICRVSVRQEMRGGRSFQKLGYADVNLAQFAGSGGGHIYLLEAYDSKHRLHNSTLKVSIDMTLLSGDPCFKAKPCPRPLHAPPPESVSGTQGSSRAVGSEGRIVSSNGPQSGSVASLPSLGYNSLDKKIKAAEEGDIPKSSSQSCPVENGHSRNSSNTSGSGYASNASHSDKSASGHARSGSQGSSGGGTYSEGGSLERAGPSLHTNSNKDPRVVSTREDASHIIDQIFEDNIGIIKTDDSAETSGLQLYIREDGTASVSGHSLRTNGEMKPIIINKR